MPTEVIGVIFSPATMPSSMLANQTSSGICASWNFLMLAWEIRMTSLISGSRLFSAASNSSSVTLMAEADRSTLSNFLQYSTRAASPFFATSSITGRMASWYCSISVSERLRTFSICSSDILSSSKTFIFMTCTPVGIFRSIGQIALFVPGFRRTFGRSFRSAWRTWA